MRSFALATVSGFLILTGSIAAEARGGNSGGSVGVVRSYIKRDGTVVAAHYRTAPDSRLDNNLTYRGRSPLRGEVPQTVGTIPQTVIAGVASEAGPAPIEAAPIAEGPAIHWHHVSCPEGKMVPGGMDSYNSFCLIN